MDHNDPRTVDERNMLHDALDSSRYPTDDTNGTAPENEEHGMEAIGAGAAALGGEANEGDDEAGAGTGALGGGVVGAALGGVVAGPPGAVVGAAVGSAAGAGAGDRTEEEVEESTGGDHYPR